MYMYVLVYTYMHSECCVPTSAYRIHTATIGSATATTADLPAIARTEEIRLLCAA